LVVDDDADIRSALGQVLELEGYEVAYAANGREAWTSLQAGPPPHLVLLDLMMPVMDGAEFLRLLRGDSRLGELPVVLVSAFGSIASAVASAVQGQLRKPLDLDDLTGTVGRFCAPRAR
jgi:CheY-like chemotaxis protein